MPERPPGGTDDEQVTNPHASSGGPGAARAPRPSARPVMPAPAPRPGAPSSGGPGDAPDGERPRPRADPGAADLFGPDAGDPVDAPTSATPVTEPAPGDPTEAVPTAAPRPGLPRPGGPRPVEPATVQAPVEQARRPDPARPAQAHTSGDRPAEQSPVRPTDTRAAEPARSAEHPRPTGQARRSESARASEQGRPAERADQAGQAERVWPVVPTRPTEHTRQMGRPAAGPTPVRPASNGGAPTSRVPVGSLAGDGTTSGVPAEDGVTSVPADGGTTSRVPFGDGTTSRVPADGTASGDVAGSEARTRVLPRVTPAGQGPGTRHLPGPAGDPGGPDAPGGDGPGGGGGDDGPGGGSGDESGSRRPRRRGLLVAGAVVAVLVVAYLADLLISSGSVPRGVTVAGQDIGGLSRAAAIERLHSVIEPRTTQPVQVTAGAVRSQIDPRASGLSIDYEGTLDRAGSQPLNPFTRIASFFGTRDVPVVNKADTRALRTAVDQLGPVVDQDPKDGNVRFDGVTPVPVAPEPGQHLDVDAAVGTLEQQWASGAPVALPLQIVQPSTTPDDVQKAIDQVARPAVSAPLTVTGEGANATVAPQDIAKVLTFKADPQAAVKLTPQINVEGLTDVVQPQLASTEKPAVDATLDLTANPARVVPSVDGRGIDYKASFANLVPVLTGTGPRQVAAVYAPKPPKLTTQAIQSLGSATEISSFTTGGFAADSGINIHRAADGIDGMIVAPGETFSLNGATDPRDASTGYVDAGIIEDGHPARGIGGGVSQLATTLYNASYFAGMTDVEHKEHSYYISRYPVAREATVFEGLIDVKFRNDGPTPVLIRTQWTPSTITVKFLGQKRVDVTSQTGPKTDFTQPQVVTIPPGQPCHPSNGAPGFTATDTKTTRDLQTGETTSKTRTVKYNPSPIVQCGG